MLSSQSQPEAPAQPQLLLDVQAPPPIPAAPAIPLQAPFLETSSADYPNPEEQRPVRRLFPFTQVAVVDPTLSSLRIHRKRSANGSRPMSRAYDWIGFSIRSRTLSSLVPACLRVPLLLVTLEGRVFRLNSRRRAQSYRQLRFHGTYLASTSLSQQLLNGYVTSQ